MGRRHRRRRSCPCAKVTFTSRGAALAAIETIRHGHRNETVPCRAYACPSGWGWHLTSQVGDHAATRAKGAA